jgi:hypothetical protein
MNSKLKNIYLFLTITLTMASVHAMGPLGWLCGGGGSCRSKSKANSMGESVAYTVDNSQQSKDISYLASPIAPVLMQRSRVDDDNDDEGEVQQQQQRRQDSSAASEYDEYEDDEFSSVERFVDDDSRHHLTSLQLYKMAFDADRPEYSKYFHVPGNLAVHSTPFHVEGRYVLDLQGRRVKFACINWPAHGPWLLPEVIITIISF